MDVILDSNVYLSDIRMESIRFKNLFDYLRRAKSSLVLPRLVREEMIAKYRRLLDEQARKTGKALKELNRLIFKKTSQLHYSPPKSVTAAREVHEKFRNLQKVGVVRYYPETLGIDVSEVFLRGVKRKRPANSEGEELRDVIIWLIALQYAEVEKKSVALVTADGGFWDDTGIHEHLKEDIDQRKVNVSLFRSIDDFIKSSAPQPIPVDEAYILKFFDVTSVGDQILAAAKKQISTSKRLLWQSFTVQSIKSMSLRFSKGNVYDIDADTKFAELTYDVLVVAEFAFTEQQVFSPIFGSGGLGVSFGGIASPLGMLPPLSIVDQQRELLSVLNRPRPSQEASRLNRVVKRYNILVKAQISIRLVKDTLTENELDGIEIDKVEEMAEAG